MSLDITRSCTPQIHFAFELVIPGSDNFSFDGSYGLASDLVNFINQYEDENGYLVEERLAPVSESASVFVFSMSSWAATKKILSSYKDFRKVFSAGDYKKLCPPMLLFTYNGTTSRNSSKKTMIEGAETINSAMKNMNKKISSLEASNDRVLEIVSSQSNAIKAIERDIGNLSSNIQMLGFSLAETRALMDRSSRCAQLQNTKTNLKMMLRELEIKASDSEGQGTLLDSQIHRINCDIKDIDAELLSINTAPTTLANPPASTIPTPRMILPPTQTKTSGGLKTVCSSSDEPGPSSIIPNAEMDREGIHPQQKCRREEPIDLETITDDPAPKRRQRTGKNKQVSETIQSSQTQEDIAMEEDEDVTISPLPLPCSLTLFVTALKRNMSPTPKRTDRSSSPLIDSMTRRTPIVCSSSCCTSNDRCIYSSRNVSSILTSHLSNVFFRTNVLFLVAIGWLISSLVIVSASSSYFSTYSLNMNGLCGSLKLQHINQSILSSNPSVFVLNESKTNTKVSTNLPTSEYEIMEEPAVKCSQGHLYKWGCILGI